MRVGLWGEGKGDGEAFLDSCCLAGLVRVRPHGIAYNVPVPSSL